MLTAPTLGSIRYLAMACLVKNVPRMIYTAVFRGSTQYLISHGLLFAAAAIASMLSLPTGERVRRINAQSLKIVPSQDTCQRLRIGGERDDTSHRE